ncbi:MAG: VWA domain-containing protein [Acidobacteria bacterium]|nr:VWA domain-containing protein [Acidobacteriota bacterium]
MPRQVRIAALLVLLGTAALAASQDARPATSGQAPTFQVRVDYVEVDVRVTDKAGQFVRDLKQEDFQIFEDGRPQAVSAFSLVDIPVEKAERMLYTSSPIEPDTKTNERRFDGRVYVMIIDDLHTSFARSGRVKIAARQFIQRNLGANDLMAVVHTAGPSDANQDFTNNRRLLMAAVDRVAGRKLPSSTVNRTEEFFRLQAGGADTDSVNDPDDAERAFQAKNTLQTLKAVADWFGGIRGRRKSILLVSEGIDYDVSSVFDANAEAHNQASSIIDAMREVVSSATRGNVAIYGIDPRGLTGLEDESIAVGTFPTALPDDQGMSSKDVNQLGIGTRSLMNEVRVAQDSLRQLSDETGGFAVVNRNQFDTAFGRIVDDNSAYYVLAYYPPANKPDSFHRIEVRLPGRPDLAVRARRGYTVPKAGAASNPNRPASAAAMAEVLDALDSPLPISGLTLRVFAAPFKGTSPNASVLLGVELRGADLQPGPGSVVQVSYRAIDAQGKVRAGNTDSVTLNLRPETRARLEATGLRMLKRLDLPPGRYQLHVAAHDASSGRVGSVTYDLEVPDFADRALDMSGVVLTSSAAGAQVTARLDELLQDVLPAPPAAVRTFAPSDELTAFAEVYDAEGDRAHTVGISAIVLSDTGQELFRSREERSSADLGGRRGGYGFVARIPLKDLSPGGYVLKIEAQSTLGDRPIAAREVPFRVEAPALPAR